MIFQNLVTITESRAEEFMLPGFGTKLLLLKILMSLSFHHSCCLAIMDFTSFTRWSFGGLALFVTAGLFWNIFYFFLLQYCVAGKLCSAAIKYF